MKFKHIFSSKSIASIKTFAFSHKIASAFIALAVIGVGWYAFSVLTSTAGQTRYVLGTVTKGTVVASVSASGQVAASDELSIKPKVSGDIVWVGVKPGDVVRAGQGIMQIDNTDAKKAVASAERSLAASKLQLEQDTVQAPIDYQKAQDALTTAQDNLETEYNNAYNAISDTYLNLPTAMTGAQNILYGYDMSTNGQWNVDALANFFQNDDRISVDVFKTSALTDYAAARAAYDTAALAYKGTTRTSSHPDTEKLLAQSITMTTDVAQALQSELNFLGTVIDLAQQRSYKLSPTVTTLQSNARSYLSTVNGNLSALLSEKKLLDSGKQTITNNQNAITLLSVGNPDGANPISLQVTQNSIASAEENLANLRQTLADYVVTVPFGGTIAALNVKRYDTAGSGTAVATLITNQRIATVSLNEVDATKIHLGDKVTLTFDAIDSLSLTGAVAELDSIGTVSQGVVSYTVKIGFDTQDPRVKPGMTVNAAIITDAHQDVLSIPSSAVKTQGGAQYVQVFTPALSAASLTAQAAGTQGVASAVLPTNVPVTVGISDDTNTEILTGLSEGQQIVARTISATAKATTQTAPSLFGGGGGVRTGGGGARGGG